MSNEIDKLFDELRAELNSGEKNSEARMIAVAIVVLDILHIVVTDINRIADAAAGRDMKPEIGK